MPYRSIGEKLRTLRGRHSQSEVAKCAGISEPLLSLIEAGHRSLQPSATALARVLGFEVMGLGGEERALDAEAEALVAVREVLMARLERAASELIAKAHPRAEGAWSEDPGDMATLTERMAEHRRLMLTIPWAEVFTADRLADQANVHLGEGDRKIAEEECLRWIATLTDESDLLLPGRQLHLRPKAVPASSASHDAGRSAKDRSGRHR
jgi:transcriptional regulator with XRE-family HTH domain